MAQCLKVGLQVQLHKEIVNCGFADQADPGEGELGVRWQGRQDRNDRRGQAAAAGQVEALTGQPEAP